ncbi:MAG: hypothetical protein ACP5N7_07025 [Candidatus Pacearchaeota archaeon]
MREPRYITKIKNKQTKTKADTTIWNCLTLEVKVENEYKIETSPIVIRKNRRQRRLQALKNMLKVGKSLNDRQIRRYVRLAKIESEQIPSNILDKFEIVKIKPRIKRVYTPKKAKKKIKKSNRKRVPSQYETYIKSPLWEERKNKYFQLYPRKCSICLTSKYIHLHHAIYEKYGEEEDGNLFPLCGQHHKLFHKELGRTKKDMLRETLLFIEEQKNLSTCKNMTAYKKYLK